MAASGGRGVVRDGVVARDEGEQAEVGDRSGAAGCERERDEADAEEDRVDAEVVREAGGDAAELAVGGGSGELFHASQSAAPDGIAPLGMTLTHPLGCPG